MVRNIANGYGPALVFEALERLAEVIARGRRERAERALRQNEIRCELKEDYARDREQIRELNQLLKLEKMIKREVENLRAQGVDEECIRMFVDESRKMRRM